jgi:hypothetical protein
MDRRIIIGGAIALAFTATAILVTRGEESDPEAQIRAALDRAVAAIEAKKIGDAMDIISERFKSGDIDRRAVHGILFSQVQRSDWRRIFLADTEVSLKGETRAQVTTAAVLAGGGEVSNIGDVDPTRASVYRFELDFEKEEDDWRIVRATWRRAGFDEILTPR